MFNLSKNYKDLNPQDFKDEIKNADDAVIIDCRTPEEVAAGALPHDIDLDITDRAAVAQIDEMDKDKSYFIYCRSGNRSGQLCSYLYSRGFKKLYNLQGGIITWYHQFGNLEL